MAHPTFWPSKTFFYPIGNTAAISLTQDLSPEQSANILLLGCGDPRNILFTLHADVVAHSVPRKLDVTCCDLEPAVLARNMLLLSLIEENEDIELIWNLFYHFKFDDKTSDLLTRQSSYLAGLSSNIQNWNDSSYGSFLKIVDRRTLAEICRHWRLYADFINLPPGPLNKIHREQTKLSNFVLEERSLNRSPSRTAGIFFMEAAAPTLNWNDLRARSRSQESQQNQPHVRYCAAGEVFDPHYGTFPQGFHLTPAIAPFVSNTKITTSKQEVAIVNEIKRQFMTWADAFRKSRAVGAITIRFFSGDAIAFCRALDLFATTGNPATNVFVSAWRAAQVNLYELSASDPPAPTTFDVIDTSNLTDHLGLLNLLLVTQPLLTKNPASQSVLYTETLLPIGEDATKSFLDRICATIPTLSTLLGIAPRAYVSGFNSHSNAHELMYPEYVDQYHERVVWVDASSGDRNAYQREKNIAFNCQDLAYILFGFYDKMFASEQVVASLFTKPSLSKIYSMECIDYHRETMGALAQLIKRRIRVKNGDWDSVAERFLEIVQQDRSRMIGMNNYQDLLLQLYLFGVFVPSTLRPNWKHSMGDPSPNQIFRNLSPVPPILCVVMTVPRKFLQVLLADNSKTGTPTLQCILGDQRIHSNAYSALYAAWGRCVSSPGAGTLNIDEDPQGIHGSADLVVSFWAASWILEFKDSSVTLALKSTPHTTMFVPKLGMELALFSAKLDDTKHVQILPYRPSLTSNSATTVENAVTRFSDPILSTGSNLIMANISTEGGCCNVTSFTAHVEIESTREQKALLNGADVSISQISPCTMQLSIAGHQQIIPYPYPILGTSGRLRVARKSHYVEIIVPVSQPLDSGGYHLEPFPVLCDNTFNTWNIHHISIDRMPRINLDNPKIVQSLNTHTALQLSDRERIIREGDSITKAADINTMVNVKESIMAITMQCSGALGPKPIAIGLREPNKGGIYAILLIGSLRFDLASFTIVVDCAVVSLYDDVMFSLLSSIQKLNDTGRVAQVVTSGRETVAWKRLIPAYVERCRTWVHQANCEYTAQGLVPLSIRVNENPICSCGQGVGFNGPDWTAPEWKGLLPFATRAAISPIFAVSYVENVAAAARSKLSNLLKTPKSGVMAPKKLDDSVQEGEILLVGMSKPGLETPQKEM